MCRAFCLHGPAIFPTVHRCTPLHGHFSTEFAPCCRGGGTKACSVCFSLCLKAVLPNEDSQNQGFLGSWSFGGGGGFLGKAGLPGTAGALP